MDHQLDFRLGILKILYFSDYKYNAFILIDPSLGFSIGYSCLRVIEMNIKEKKKDYLVYLLWIFGVIPSNIIKNYIFVKSPTLKAQKVLYLIK